MLYYILFSPETIRLLGIDFVLSEAIAIFESTVRRFELLGLPNEFDKYGGARGAAVHNIRVVLERYPNEEIRLRLSEQIPELLQS